MDECRLNENFCHPNATCKNIIGLYECHCLSGFDGDGFNCTGGLNIFSQKLITVMPTLT